MSVRMHTAAAATAAMVRITSAHSAAVKSLRLEKLVVNIKQ